MIMITDSFDDKTRPLVSLSDFYGEQKHIVDVCLVTFSYVIRDEILSRFECEQIAAISAANGAFPIYKFKYKGKDVAFYLSAIGSALSANFVAEANWLTGAKKFVMFGSSGSLNNEITANKFVIPTEAYRDEGMSYHYAPPCDYIKIKNSEIVKGVFEKLNLPYVEGRIWTTDAFLRETVGQAQLRRAEGCIAVEMEVAGVQAVCDFYGFELYDFLVTGDVLMEEIYDVTMLSNANHNIDKLSVALEIANQI